jgi:hypothetical protein
MKTTISLLSLLALFSIGSGRAFASTQDHSAKILHRTERAAKPVCRKDCHFDCVRGPDGRKVCMMKCRDICR